MRQIVIFGTGSLAQVCCYYLRKSESHCVSGFIVDPEYKDSNSLMDLPVASTEDANRLFPADTFDMLVAIGYSNMRARDAVISRMASNGYRFTNLVPENNFEGRITGSNNIIMPGSIIEPFVSVGNNNVIWSGSHICHDTTLGDNNFLAAGSVIGGCVTVASGSFFGFGSVVIEKLIISDETLVAAGAVVIRNTEPYSRYTGIPAEKTGEHADKGIIL
jgi:sugar O-acyltransferase (sialic acid O-acetyltransferase NeuD family)